MPKKNVSRLDKSFRDYYIFFPRACRRCGAFDEETNLYDGQFLCLRCEFYRKLTKFKDRVEEITNARDQSKSAPERKK